MSEVVIVPGDPEACTHSFALRTPTGVMGFRLADEDSAAMSQSPSSPSSLVGGGSSGQFGTYDELFADYVIADFSTGMGVDEYDISRSGFAHSKNMWTMQGDKAYPAPMHQYGDGIRTVIENQADNKTWKQLIGTLDQYVSLAFTVGASDMTADNLEIWVRKNGTPGTLTAAIYTNSAGSPGTLVASASDTLLATEVTDVLAIHKLFDLSAAANLTAATIYHVVIYGADTDTRDNCWEIKVDMSGTTSKVSAAGSSWAAPSDTFDLIYRLTDTNIDRQWKMFWWKWLMYTFDVRPDGTASKLYANGWRGNATAGATTTLTNTNGGYTADELIGWYIYIYDGTGAGQSPRLITDNTATVITVAGWEKTPAAGSLYVIFGGDKLNLITITGTALGAALDFALTDNEIFFAQGSGTNILRVQWDSTVTPAYDGQAAGTYKADFLLSHPNAISGPQVWRGENDLAGDGVVVSRADSPKTWAGSGAFGSDIEIGDRSHLITDLALYNNELHVMKQNHPFKVSNDKATPVVQKSGFIVHPDNGKGAMEHDIYFMVPWGGNFLAQHYGSGGDDVSPAQRGDGLPSDELGSHSSMISHPGGVISIVDGGRDNYSSIMVMDDKKKGWHPIFRSYRTGQRIQTVYWQDNMAGKPKLWFSIGGDLMYMEFPKGFRSLKDTTHKYHFEGVLELGTITLEARTLLKLFESVLLFSEKLSANTRVRMQYKIDEKIDDSDYAWRDIGYVERSGAVELAIQAGNASSIRFRLIFETVVATTPAVVSAITMKGLARKPNRDTLTFRVATESLQVDYLGNEDSSPDAVKYFLLEHASNMVVLNLESQYLDMNGMKLILQPPQIVRLFAGGDHVWGAEFMFQCWVVEEAPYVESD